MLRSLILLSAIVLMSACGEDKAPPAAPETPASASSAVTTAPAAPSEAASVDEAMPAAADDEEIQYDPIDVSKLDNQWWKQYSAGS